MTDDDLVMPGAVAAVLHKTSTGAGLIVVDAEVRNMDFSRTHYERRLMLQTDRIYEANELEKLFIDVCDHLTFVRAIIIKRSEKWLDRDKQPYVGTGFIHVGVLFQRPFATKAVVIARPLVCRRLGNALWGARSFTIWNVNWPALVWSFNFSDEAKGKVVAREPWRSIKKLVGFRIVGAYSIQQYRDVIAPRLKSRWSFLPGLWVAHFPVMPLKVFAGVRQLVRTRHWN